MKKTILSLVAIFACCMTGSAQQAWDFTQQLSAADATALQQATAQWTYDEAKSRYENTTAIDGAITAGGQELQLTQGLTVTAAANKLRIDAGSRLQLAGKNIPLSTPALQKGQQVEIVFASTGNTAVTFDANTNLTNAQGFTAADKNTTQTGTATVAADGVVTFKCSGGSINIFSIRVSGSGETPADEDNADVTANAVPRNQAQSQALLTLTNGDRKFYNTQQLAAIDIDDATGLVTLTQMTGAADTYHGTIAQLAFAKKEDTGQDITIDNQGVTITEAQGWLESAYLKFSLYEGATSYNVYVQGGQYADFTLIDQQLVRNYGSYGRADATGLQAGTYQMRVAPVVDGTELTAQASTASGITVKNFSRQGYAHFGYQGVGAYQDNGQLKPGAKVFYVTKNTAKTIKTTVVTSTKGATTECTGLQAIIEAYEKGCDTTPIVFRFIGLVTIDDLDHIGSSEEGIQVKGRSADSELNITFEGIGDDATIRGFGFLVRNAKSVEFRNLAIMRCMDDGISLDTNNSNIWIHNIDVFYGKHGSGDHDKGDGSVDVKSNSKFVTVSYCHYWDTGKTNMFGMKSESGPNYISYDHNWFDHSDSRHPRVRTMSVHVWNNYFDNCAKYGVGATSGSSVFVENNYFLKTKKPILASKQGTDALGSGTFSGEDGGMIKAFGNYFDRTIKNFSYYTQASPASTGYDAYEVASRDEQVPATEVTRQGGTSYNNFDTNPQLIYDYDADLAEDVPAIVTGYYGAGRLNHGDVAFTFADNVGNDDTDSAVDAALSSLIDSYTSPLVGLFGEDNGQGTGGGDTPGGGGNDDDDPVVGPQPVDGEILCTFDKSGNPSSSFFTVSGNGSNSKGQATVDGQVLTTCLKMESATSIKFSLSQPMVMTLYFADTETASIKINGTKISGTSSTYTETLQPGDYELTKDKSVNLFAIKLVPLS